MAELQPKKVLIITYYWPPSGGGGVQRWLKFAKYLPQFGWEPIIFTPENPGFELKDESLAKDISPALEVLKFPIWEPYSIFKKLSGKRELKQGQVLEEGKNGFFPKMAIWLRGNLFIPDPRVFWVKPSANYIASILETNGIKTVITTGPPHSMHLIGLKLKMKDPSITWLADFRDPWSHWDLLKKFRMMPITWKKHRALEQKVLRAADCTITVSKSWKTDFEKLGARRTKVITNGYDAEDFVHIEKHEAATKFRISHIGMLNSLRNPQWFWEALNELATEAEFRKDLELEFVGILSEEILDSIHRLENLSDAILKQNYLSHDEVLAKYPTSSMLLLLQNDSENAKGHLPGKLFEYLGAKKPILCIGNKESDLAEILNKTGAGKVFDANSKEQLKAFVLNAYQLWKQQKSPIEFMNIEQYERKNLTEKLADVLNSLGTR